MNPLAYHRHGIQNGSGYNRQAVLARMLFDDQDNILLMDPMVPAFKPGDRGEPIINGKGLPEDPLTAGKSQRRTFDRETFTMSMCTFQRLIMIGLYAVCPASVMTAQGLTVSVDIGAEGKP